jgi:hypothetical protein
MPQSETRPSRALTRVFGPEVDGTYLYKMSVYEGARGEAFKGVILLYNSYVTLYLAALRLSDNTSPFLTVTKSKNF